MRHRVLFCLGSVALAFKVAAQTAVDVTRPEEQTKSAAGRRERAGKAREAGEHHRISWSASLQGKRTAHRSEGGNHYHRRLRAKSGARRRSRVFSRSLLPQAWLCGRECALHDRITEPVAPRYYRGSALHGGDDRLRWECARAKRQAF